MTICKKLRKILVILPSYDSGGAENYALRLIRYEGSVKIEWHVTSGNLRNAQLEPVFREAGAHTHYVSTGFLSPMKVLEFKRFIKTQGFYAIINLNGVFSGLSMRIARMAGVPLRIAWHRRSMPAYRSSLARRLYSKQALRWLESSSTHILSNNRAALDHFHGVGWASDDRFQVIPNGVDARQFIPRPEERASIRAELGIPHDALVIGHVGRVDPAKDHDTLLAAARILTQRLDNMRLLLVGTGTASVSFHARIQDAGLMGFCHCVGVRTDMYRVYQAMDLFLFPSLTEGQPNALIEAMLSGVPVVATNIRGIAEAVPPSIANRLIPPQDASRLADAVEKALATPPSELTLIRTWAESQYDLSKNLSAAIKPLVAE